MKIAVYPGSFDPITLGHLNIIKRAAAIFDELLVCVMVNSGKTPMFTLDERVDFIKRVCANFGNVRVESSDGLLVNYVKQRGAQIIVKGLRTVSDFDWELHVALANKKVSPDIETLFLASSEKYTYLSSSVVREMAKYGADIKEFVPKEIIDDIVKKAMR